MQQSEFAIELKSKSGKRFLIEMDDMGENISVSQEGVHLGSISLDVSEDDSHYHITGLSLDNCPPGQGIGRACLQTHIEWFAKPITAESHHEVYKREDGSHLTGRGPGFVAKMRQEGLIQQYLGYYADMDL